MRFPLAWLREFVTLPEDPDRVARAFTFSGTEVEGQEVVEGEVCLEFGITVNRPDCMCAFGLAREGAALFGAALKPPDTAVEREGPAVSDLAAVEVRDGALCPRYRALVLTGVRVGESPAWMRKRLLQCGLRPINAVVDATNYVLLEMGHPLHAFDLSQVEGRKVVVRTAAAGEKIRTLDGVERALKPDMLVIADARKAMAVAGVMGGEASGVTGRTVDLLLEGAVFHPVSIRRTAKALGLHTDASHRYERGVSMEGPVTALDRCARLILAHCGGRLASGEIDRVAPRAPAAPVPLRLNRIRAIVGMEIPPDRCSQILEALGFGVTRATADRWEVTVPAWRVDVTREIDLVEEIVRVHGLEDLPSHQPPVVDPVGGRPVSQRFEETLRDALAASGFSEAVNMSLSDPVLEAQLAPGAELVRLTNPMSETASVLRASLTAGLLAAAQRNRARGVRRLALFEIGHVFSATGETHREEARAAVLLYDDDPPRRYGEPESRGILDLKGALERAFQLSRVGVQIVPGNGHPFAEGHALSLEVGGKSLGAAGTLDPSLMGVLGLRGRAHVAEFALEALGGLVERPRFRPFSKFPAVVRDFSVLAPADVPWARLRAVLEGLSLAHLVSVGLVEAYGGRGLPPGMRSWTFSLAFQAPDRTLEDGDVKDVSAVVERALRESLGASLRAGETHAV